jgi:hypothetical protein
MHHVQATQDIYGQPDSLPLAAAAVNNDDAEEPPAAGETIPALKARRSHRTHRDLQTSRPITLRLPRDTISVRGKPSCTGRALIVRCASPTTPSVWLPSRGTGLQTAPPGRGQAGRDWILFRR